MTPEQKNHLQQPLDPKHVSKREQAGRKLSYIEGWHAIAEANRIFGHDGWCRETIYLKEVCRYEVPKSRGTGTNWKIGFEAKVRITVSGVTREGTGYGSGTMGDLYDAMESAGKEAETDAMKRAFMTLGNPFGLALYDKTKANVGVPEQTDTVQTYNPPQSAPQRAVPDKAAQNKLRQELVSIGNGHAAHGLAALHHWWQHDLTKEERTLIGPDSLALLKSIAEQSTKMEAAE